MNFAVFDLDKTLLPADSGDAWTRTLIAAGPFDREKLNALATEHARAYREGGFDPEAYMAFQYGMMAACPRRELEALRDTFVQTFIRPRVTPQALALIASRREAGFVCVLASGTHRFVTAPAGPLFGIDLVVGSEPETGADGEFTGRMKNGHGYGEGKRRLTEAFVTQYAHEHGAEPEIIEAYSDSINDLPLLEWAAAHGAAVAVNPDEAMRAAALERGWRITEIF